MACLEAGPAWFSPTQERVQNERGEVQFSAVKLGMEMQMNSASVGVQISGG